MSTVLVVCTANRCRSPFAAAFLARNVARAGLDVTVASGGLLPGGGLVPEELVAVGLDRGLELADHVSRQVTPADVDAADLVVGMGREHLRGVAIMGPDVFSRAFTLPELVRRAVARGQGPATGSLRRWAAALSEGRRPVDVLADDPADEVPDPMGGPPEAYRAMADTLTVLLNDLTLVVWGPAAGAQ